MSGNPLLGVTRVGVKGLKVIETEYGGFFQRKHILLFVARPWGATKEKRGTK